ncbi:putative nuclease HARBI1 [Mytilus californianus]|uniref:putative nuclease HARBI1 n=1 Tax=Mytilus californianus TaxID=6549 RepID=UPI0022462E30|nr:putative nuclease HARBI1 [Mytilus californianus]
MAAFMQVPVPPQRKERHFRLKDDLSLNLSNEELRERYRFGREGIMFISNLVSNDESRKTKRNHALTVPQQVMVTMRFLATGSFLQVVGDTIVYNQTVNTHFIFVLYRSPKLYVVVFGLFTGLHKGTVSRIVSDVLNSLRDKRDEFIKWPINVDETRGDFYRLSGFPNVLGAIDGTHIRIQAPSEDEPSFVNRKGVHSVNVQAVCDARGKFTNINANWPGSSHDSHIFRTSQVCTYMEQNGGWANGVLLGDSGYPCRPFLMTPYQNPVQDHQKKYNRCHCSTKSVIERTFGRLKRRFHILHSEIKHKKNQFFMQMISVIEHKGQG